MSEPYERETVDSCAAYLRDLAAAVRSDAAANPNLVLLHEYGVERQPITVADALWLTALRLDGRTTNEETGS